MMRAGIRRKNESLVKQARRERRLERSALDQHRRNDPALHGDLQPLRQARGQLPALLDPAQMIGRQLSFAQRFEENVGCRHRILDRQIDADTADRRHGVGGVANAQETRPEPFQQTVYREPSIA